MGGSLMVVESSECPGDVPIAKGGELISATDFFLQISVPSVGRGSL